MRTRVVSAARLIIVALFFIVSTVASARAQERSVSGEVVDASGARLPGVTITATGPEGRPLAVEVTDASGSYAFRALPPGVIALTFEIEGFARSETTVTLEPGVASNVVQRMEVAPFADKVVVRGLTPRVPLAPESLPGAAASNSSTGAGVQRDAICGPAKPATMQESLGTIAGGRENDQLRDLHGAGAEFAIDGGLASGLSVGTNVIARRYEKVMGELPANAIREHSAGLLQIVEADTTSSVAVVVFACDEIRVGDFLAAITPQPRQDRDLSGVPDFRNAAKILFADEGQRLGAPRRLMVIDRGTDNGTFVGQRFTLFRRFRGSEREAVGNAVVVAVRNDSATIRVERVVDAITAGDWAAPQVPSLDVLSTLSR